MRAALRWSAVGLAMVLSVGAADAQYVWKGNDTGGVIPWSCENEAIAVEVATAYCVGWNKFARITSVQRFPGQFIGFNCLWRPDVARFQLPAVRTRACVTVVTAPRLHPRVQVRY